MIEVTVDWPAVWELVKTGGSWLLFISLGGALGCVLWGLVQCLAAIREDRQKRRHKDRAATRRPVANACTFYYDPGVATWDGTFTNEGKDTVFVNGLEVKPLETIGGLPPKKEKISRTPSKEEWGLIRDHCGHCTSYTDQDGQGMVVLRNDLIHVYHNGSHSQANAIKCLSRDLRQHFGAGTDPCPSEPAKGAKPPEPEK